MFRTALCVIIQQVLHDGYGLLHKLGVSVIDRNLEESRAMEHMSDTHLLYEARHNLKFTLTDHFIRYTHAI